MNKIESISTYESKNESDVYDEYFFRILEAFYSDEETPINNVVSLAIEGTKDALNARKDYLNNQHFTGKLNWN